MSYRLFLFLFLSAGLVFGGITGILFYLGTNRLIDLSSLEHYNPNRPSVVLDDQGIEFMRFQLDRREPIALSEMPNHLINAFIAAEDRQFFSHNGISLRSIIRSVLVNISRGRRAQGASTITQQLIKNLFFTPERSFTRKIKEQLLSLYLEWRFTKEQILETYLNHICFGEGIYGVQAATHRFWGISTRKLSPAQSASLAAIIRRPAYYCPLLHPENTLTRRNLILKLELENGFIDQKVYEAACAEPLNLKTTKERRLAPHVREMIRKKLEEIIGRAKLYSGGYLIQTTISQHAQRRAEEVFHYHISSLRTLQPNIDGALVCLDVGSGAIKALVGGVDFNNSHFNRAEQASRQMGSIFKPLIYASAVEQGRSLTNIMIDEPLSINAWEPRNFNRRFDGPMTLAHALVTSNNIIAVKLLLESNINRIIYDAYRAHLPGPFQPYPSLALGCTDCSPLHAAGMFNIFANKGVYCEPHLVLWIKDRWGNRLWRSQQVVEQVFDWRTTSQIARVLQIVMERLKVRLPRWPLKGQALAKTGTTNEHRTCWFAGSTPTHTTIIYLGCDDNSSMEGKISSGWHGAPIWLDFNATIESPQASFVFEPSLTQVTVQKKTGLPTSERGADTLSLFIPTHE
ncbi:MAG: transglycosylase domain-containing protein [Candidatus Babeliaceae bacterium]|nr:transglycosylase domain-containing protein [Candidatus Babeliaceae bacterium]